MRNSSLFLVIVFVAMSGCAVHDKYHVEYQEIVACPDLRSEPKLKYGGSENVEIVGLNKVGVLILEERLKACREPEQYSPDEGGCSTPGGGVRATDSSFKSVLRTEVKDRTNGRLAVVTKYRKEEKKVYDQKFGCRKDDGKEQIVYSNRWVYDDRGNAQYVEEKTRVKGCLEFYKTKVTEDILKTTVYVYSACE